ncbi:unnamed protein product [Phyllotreta striolata]|uniref:Uncharacterized protein n=1 Tax=Phyllotreta striolata TaxID=444603 RepID=A0A9N9XMT9_PHYSR|nr:unnamed protein product [Phyllotreta striolata]
MLLIFIILLIQLNFEACTSASIIPTKNFDEILKLHKGNDAIENSNEQINTTLLLDCVKNNLLAGNAVAEVFPRKNEKLKNLNQLSTVLINLIISPLRSGLNVFVNNLVITLSSLSQPSSAGDPVQNIVFQTINVAINIAVYVITALQNYLNSVLDSLTSIANTL